MKGEIIFWNNYGVLCFCFLLHINSTYLGTEKRTQCGFDLDCIRTKVLYTQH